MNKEELLKLNYYDLISLQKNISDVIKIKKQELFQEIQNLEDFKLILEFWKTHKILNFSFKFKNRSFSGFYEIDKSLRIINISIDKDLASIDVSDEELMDYFENTYKKQNEFIEVVSNYGPKRLIIIDMIENFCKKYNTEYNDVHSLLIEKIYE